VGGRPVIARAQAGVAEEEAGEIVFVGDADLRGDFLHAPASFAEEMFGPGETEFVEVGVRGAADLLDKKAAEMVRGHGQARKRGAGLEIGVGDAGFDFAAEAIDQRMHGPRKSAGALEVKQEQGEEVAGGVLPAGLFLAPFAVKERDELEEIGAGMVGVERGGAVAEGALVGGEEEAAAGVLGAFAVGDEGWKADDGAARERDVAGADVGGAAAAEIEADFPAIVGVRLRAVVGTDPVDGEKGGHVRGSRFCPSKTRFRPFREARIRRSFGLMQMQMTEALAALGAGPETLTESDRASLDRDGYMIVPDAIPTDVAAAMAQRLDEIAAEEGENAGKDFQIEKGATRLGTLINKGAIFDASFLHPRGLAAVNYIMHGDFGLSSITGRAAMPGAGDQGLHRDNPVYDSANVIWAVSDFTPQNGPTRLIPGSHRFPGGPDTMMADPKAKHPDEIYFIAKAGTLLVINGRTWHGGTRNGTDKPRHLISAFFLPRGKYQTEANRRLSEASRKRLSEAAKFVIDHEE
jgi:hypothetical protein